MNLLRIRFRFGFCILRFCINLCRNNLIDLFHDCSDLFDQFMFQMESKDGDLDINCLERGLLSENGSRDDCEAEGEAVFYTASFEENEENFVKYQQPNGCFTRCS